MTGTISRIFVSFVANWVVLWKNFLEGPTASAIIRFVCNDDNAIKKHYREVFYEKTVFICTVVSIAKLHSHQCGDQRLANDRFKDR
jgi:hypothetical protein